MEKPKVLSSEQIKQEADFLIATLAMPGIPAAVAEAYKARLEDLQAELAGRVEELVGQQLTAALGGTLSKEILAGAGVDVEALTSVSIKVSFGANGEVIFTGIGKKRSGGGTSTGETKAPRAFNAIEFEGQTYTSVNDARKAIIASLGLKPETGEGASPVKTVVELVKKHALKIGVSVNPANAAAKGVSTQEVFASFGMDTAYLFEYAAPAESESGE